MLIIISIVKVHHINFITYPTLTSEQENPNQTKHIGLWLKNLQNLTIDGKGARIITHGEIATESFRKVCS